MSATRKPENESYFRAAAVAREVRSIVATQLHDLIVEADEMAGPSELVELVQRVGHCQKSITRAQGRQQQAREMGLPLAPAVAAEREGRELLRQAVMSLGATCGRWAAAMDFEARRREDGDLDGGGSGG